MTAIMSLQGISKRFGANYALNRVDFDVVRGEVTGLVGANGAGKSTLLKILAGAMRADEGVLRLDGTEISLSSVADAGRQGVAIVSQELSLFPALSVMENLWMTGSRERRIEKISRSTQMMKSLGLATPLTKKIESLSLADRQLVEIARALLQRPRVLILDEPTSALGKDEVDRLHGVIRKLRDEGVGIVYVSHFLEELLDIADSLVVLRDGKRVPATFGPGLARLPDVVEAMLGSAKDTACRANVGLNPVGAPRGYEVGKESRAIRYLPLEISKVRGGGNLTIDFLRVDPGEIVGVTGLAGAGVEELFAILFGLVKPVSGHIAYPSGRTNITSPSNAVHAGVAFIPSDRKRLGLMSGRSIADNTVSVRSLVQRRDGLLLSARRLRAAAERRCRSIGVKADSVLQRVDELSGGNQQKVVFAKWIETDPSLVILDDPTRGVDIGARAEMYRIVRSLADEGRVVLLYSSDPVEVLELADRIVVFARGRVVTTLPAAGLTEHRLVEAMNQS
ncbi:MULTISPECIES: sugar ABC transporter ATP-binding protein [Paraburkholderia]|uniref:sugar ABC transporter ATP-binding protein n=1 Tax=Paraburkholderia TaxID=1822464 RepID=UPI00225C1FE0|nr:MULTISPECIES: sugar ABC transporter ATP-binding protein [Paraburkholderia]MCX4163646.1 sugar ABC transporter ATP-binding protein [Paraburkholderia megapolitana]MDN7159141.1 sugar ABC transporter ATP-binding protein [Paraburkholderia sp. CHISQ3]MDQ6496188.1 sugar ABC transporter ATP-binding protein [Paraburkholderia megapolitana]